MFCVLSNIKEDYCFCFVYLLFPLFCYVFCFAFVFCSHVLCDVISNICRSRDSQLYETHLANWMLASVIQICCLIPCFPLWIFDVCLLIFSHLVLVFCTMMFNVLVFHHKPSSFLFFVFFLTRTIVSSSLSWYDIGMRLLRDRLRGCKLIGCWNISKTMLKLSLAT